MTDRKIGDIIRSLPTDDKQTYSKIDLDMFKKKPRREEYSDSDSDSDSDDDSVLSDDLKQPSLWYELKSTFIASVLFAILSIESVDELISKTGLDTTKLFLLKIFIFAILYFILRYRFM